MLDKATCPVCGRQAGVRSGVFVTHGPGKRGAFICQGTETRPLTMETAGITFKDSEYSGVFYRYYEFTVAGRAFLVGFRTAGKWFNVHCYRQTWRDVSGGMALNALGKTFHSPEEMLGHYRTARAHLEVIVRDAAQFEKTLWAGEPLDGGNCHVH